MRVIDDGDGLETIVCHRDNSWVQQVAETGVAVAYSDYSKPHDAIRAQLTTEGETDE